MRLGEGVGFLPGALLPSLGLDILNVGLFALVLFFCPNLFLQQLLLCLESLLFGPRLGGKRGVSLA